MTVAVHPLQFGLDFVKTLANTVQQVAGQGFIGVAQGAGDKVLQQKRSAAVAKGFRGQGRAMLKAFQSGNAVQATRESPQLEQAVQVIECRGVTTFTGVKAKSKAFVGEQGVAIVIFLRGYDWNIGIGQLPAEAVFFQNLLVGPALGPIKLGNQWLCAFDANLINTVSYLL